MTIIFQVISAYVIGAFLVYLTIPIVIRVSNAKKLYDFPDQRKVNKTKIPNLGGIALFIGITISMLLCLGKSIFLDSRYIIVGMIIMLFVGIKDDIMVISAKKKFISQIVCALILIVAGNIRFTNLHGILGINQLNYTISFIISLLTIIAIINSVNLIDGIDGLAASIGILAATVFGICFLYIDQVPYAILCFSITGSYSVFFIYNVFGKNNKIFMGDTGSLLLGLLLAVIVIKYNEFAILDNVSVRKFSPAISVAIMSVPLFDMIRVFFIRIIRKKSPFAPDMNHIHHKLLGFGLSHIACTSIIIGFNILLIGFIFLFRNLNIHFLLVLLISVASLASIIPDIIFKFRKKMNFTPKYEQFKFDFETFIDLKLQNLQGQNSSFLEMKPSRKTKEKKQEESLI